MSAQEAAMQDDDVERAGCGCACKASRCRVGATSIFTAKAATTCAARNLKTLTREAFNTLSMIIREMWRDQYQL